MDGNSYFVSQRFIKRTSCITDIFEKQVSYSILACGKETEMVSLHKFNLKSHQKDVFQVKLFNCLK